MSHSDPLDIRGQEQQQADAEQRARRAVQVEIDDLKWLMSDKRGRRCVARLLDRAGVYRLSFNTNALTMAFNEGQRNEALRLLARVTQHCPDRYAEMLKEGNDD